MKEWHRKILLTLVVFLDSQHKRLHRRKTQMESSRKLSGMRVAGQMAQDIGEQDQTARSSLRWLRQLT